MKFRLSNPTEILFGRDQISALPQVLPSNASVLLLYGAGSIKRNGVYDAVISGLAGRQVSEFGGIGANPVYETILEARQLARGNGCTFVLGVGGGSVIDAAKFLATITALDVDDPWDFLMGGGQPDTILPVGAILTLPATGSESNPVSVISRADRSLKVPFSYAGARPRFAILDPSTMSTLSRRQLENGAVDAFTHVLEQYLTAPVNAPVQFGFSEVLLDVLIEWGPRLVAENSEVARENVMWAANQALNGLIGSGVPQDWSTHMIGHAITALYQIDHARTLSMVMPSLLRHQMPGKLAMLARYGRRVWKIGEADDQKAAEAAIVATENWFVSMGCPVRTSQAEDIDISAEDIVSHIESAGQFPLGETKSITSADVRAILARAA